MFDPVDTDDDTDSVIDALQRDLEGDAIPTETPIDSRGSTLGAPRVGFEPDPIAFRRPRRLVLVQGSQVEEAGTADTESVGDWPAARDDPVVEHRGHAEVLEDVTLTPALRAALRILDEVDVRHIFPYRAVVIKSLPRLIRGAYQSAMRKALTEAVGRGAVGGKPVLCRACVLALA